MQSLEQTYSTAVELYRISFLLTGCTSRSLDIVLEELGKNSTVSPSQLPILKRTVIADSLSTIRDKLALSAIRMDASQFEPLSLPHPNWSLDSNTSKDQVDNALLAIEVFPRCALLLTVFEGFNVSDATALLHAGPELVRRALIVGLLQLTNTLASLQGWRDERANVRDIEHETQYT